MFSRFERMVAFRYLRARRREGFVSVIAWFSLLGIGLGVATLIIVMSVMNGFRSDLLTRILGLNGHVNVYAYSGYLPDYDAAAARVATLPGVVSVTPTIEGQVMATGPNSARGALVRGIRPDDFLANNIAAGRINIGSAEAIKLKDSVILGGRLAAALGLRAGDKVTLISPKGNATPFGTAPRMKAYTIAGTFNVGMYEYDSSFVFMPLEEAQKYFKRGDRVDYLELKLTHADDAGKVAKEVLGLEGLRAVEWERINASYFTALQVERNVMFLILTLIIIVAAFNIISGLIMLVKDKGRDIAILRTMGATRGMVMRVFFLSGASIGVIGTLFGLALGLLFCLNIESIRQGIQTLTGTELFSAEIYFLSHLPAKIDPTEVTAVVAMGIGLSFLATLYPSWRAARLDPVEALRYE